jgi:hypothetical protein
MPRSNQGNRIMKKTGLASAVSKNEFGIAISYGRGRYY